MSEFPDIELNLTTTIEPIDFRDGDVDVLLQYGQQGASGLNVTPFLTSPRVPVCSPLYLEGRAPVRRPEDLAELILLRDIVGDGWEDWFKCAGLQLPDAARSGPRFEHCELSLCAAEQGQGVALAYEALIDRELAEGTLVRLSDVRSTPTVIYSMTCPTEWLGRPLISAFRDWLFGQVGAFDVTSAKDAQPCSSEGYVPAVAYSH
jgi:LysR family glycine cleavage system transcriptional activator